MKVPEDMTQEHVVSLRQFIAEAMRRNNTMTTTAYTPCSCRDCIETAIVGFNGVALCHACDVAGCVDHPSWPDCECDTEDSQ